jgi:hypothetical protein
MTDGTICPATGAARSAYLWLKCDETVTTRPTTVVVKEGNFLLFSLSFFLTQISENPAYPGVATPCNYYFAPIAHKDFCPKVSVSLQKWLIILIGVVVGTVVLIAAIVVLSCCCCKCCPCYGCCRKKDYTSI